MYGIILRLDADRQQRVGDDFLTRLLPQATLNKLSAKRTSLNASAKVTSPFAPTLVRPSFYPDYFRATDIRTLFWKVRVYPELHNLTRVYVDEESRVVFEFTEFTDNTQAALESVLRGYGHVEFTDVKVRKNSLSYAVRGADYSATQAGEVSE